MFYNKILDGRDEQTMKVKALLNQLLSGGKAQENSGRKFICIPFLCDKEDDKLLEFPGLYVHLVLDK